MLKKLTHFLMSLWNKKIKRLPGRNKKILNLLKDIADGRDYKYKPANMASTEIDSIKGGVTEVRGRRRAKNQGDIGSCVTHCFCTLFELSISPKRNIDLSELFLYYVARKYEGTEDRDSGLYMRDGAKMLKDIGAALERHWPYDTSKFKQKPPAIAYISASFLRIKAYYRIYSVKAMKYCAGVDKRPVGLSLQVVNSFILNRSGVIKMPLKGEEPVGNHAVSVVEVDPEKGFLIENSWGSAWGKQGYAWVPFDYVQKYWNDAYMVEVY